ncbi:hypothetical protein [Pseudonocardia endophytica]|uniref:hypothetical protein n=1 Tax=Pseudonocardia endophytica TaxID=401976 RepID=UPI00104B0F9E|nr:hypothetical protein [Pseudonocardia endophytica]
MVRVGVFVGALVLAGLGAAVAGSVAGELTAPGATTAVRLVLLVAGALVAGLGLVHPLTGARESAPPGRWHRRVAWASGLLAAAAALAGYLHGDVSRTGTLVWVVAALAVPALLEIRHASARWTVPVAALPGVVLVAVTFGSAHTGLAFAADVVYAVASSVLLAALAALTLRAFGDGVPGPGADRALDQDGGAVGERSNSSDVLIDDRSPSARPSSGPAAAPGWPVRLGSVGLVAAVVAALAGAARILTAGPYSVIDLVGTAYGRAALVAVALPAVAAVVLLALCRTAYRRAAPVAAGATRRGGVRHDAAGAPAAADGVRSAVLAGATGAVVALGVAAASVAGLLPAPAPAAVPGQALLRTVALDGVNVPVLVAPMRPGPNLVQLGGSGYPATGDAATQQPGPGGTGAPSTPAGAAGGEADPGTAGHDMGGTAGTGGHEMATHGGSATVAADGDPVGFVSRPGARGGWAVVDIPAGTTSLTVSMAGDSATVPVSVGDSVGDAPSSALTGRDGPECASAIVGAALGGTPGTVTSCPSQALDPEQAGALTATVRTMAEKGARNVRLVGDASPRSVAATRLVRDEGRKAGLAFTPDAGNDPNSALVVVSGWEQAVDVLGEVRQRAATTPTHLGGTFLAPWLLTGDVLRQTASAFLPLSFAPNEPEAQRFALALAATHPDTAPSASGYLAWAREIGVRTDPRPSLYGAAAVNVPMSIEPQGSSGHHGGPDPAAWFPGGTVVPVSGPMEGSP